MAQRTLHRLTAAKVRSITEEGRHSDGGGLYLVVTPGGTRNWSFMWKRDKKRREMGLGAFPVVSVAEARARAEAARMIVREGGDPLAHRQKGDEPTFSEVAEQFISAHEVSWRNPKHRAQWRSTIKAYCAPIADTRVSEVDTDGVLECLSPIWTTKAETASRVRGRIERVLAYATARGWREGPNPAMWRGHLSATLPAPSKLQRGHHPAMPYEEVPSFMAALSERQGMAARALAFTILTAARSGEVRLATWGELDLSKSVWTIPAGRMKAFREHHVPLTPHALDLLSALPRRDDGDIVFPGMRGKPMSDMTLTAVLKRMGVNDASVHGFRSSFRDWAAEETGFANEVAEMAIAHAVGSKVEAAYRRGDLFQKRRGLMEAWGEYCDEV